MTRAPRAPHQQTVYSPRDRRFPLGAASAMQQELRYEVLAFDRVDRTYESLALERLAMDRTNRTHDRGRSCHPGHRLDLGASFGEKWRPAELCRRRTAAKAPCGFSRRHMEQRRQQYERLAHAGAVRR